MGATNDSANGPDFLGQIEAPQARRVGIGASIGGFLGELKGRLCVDAGQTRGFASALRVVGSLDPVLRNITGL